MDLGLRQQDLACRLSTSVFNIWNWEANGTSPSFRYLPRLVEFLGYAPFDMSQMTLGQQIRTCRRMLGLSQKGMARCLGAHPDTVASWENDIHQPMGRHRKGLQALLTTTGLAFRPAT